MSKGSHFKTALSFAIIDSIEATALKFINNPKMLKNNKSVFEWKKLNQLELSLKYNRKITLGEFIFNNTVNSGENLN